MAAGDLRIIFGCDVHGSIFESGDIVGKLAYEFCRKFAFLGDASSQFSGIVLNILKHKGLVKT